MPCSCNTFIYSEATPYIGRVRFIFNGETASHTWNKAYNLVYLKKNKIELFYQLWRNISYSESFISELLWNLLKTSEKLNLDRSTLSSEQIVTAGNGIFHTGLDLSSNDTMTGVSFHLSHTWIVKYTYAAIKSPKTKIQNNLKLILVRF